MPLDVLNPLVCIFWDTVCDLLKGTLKIYINFMNSWYEFQLYDFDIYCDGDIVSL